MNTIKFDKKSAKIIAHRGLSGIETENTNAAFVAAGNRSYFGIETDVCRTADGNFVIFHDDNTLRISGTDMLVGQSSFNDLRQLLLFDINGEKIRRDLTVSTVEEYISICKKYEKICVLELKKAMEREDVHRIAAKAEAAGYLNGVIFIAFSLQNLLYLREKYPTQPAQYLKSKAEDIKALTETLVKNNLDLDIRYTALDKDMVMRMHDSGIKVNCWTVDDPAAGEEIASWGVDYITTNILE